MTAEERKQKIIQQLEIVDIKIMATYISGKKGYLKTALDIIVGIRPMLNELIYLAHEEGYESAICTNESPEDLKAEIRDLKERSG